MTPLLLGIDTALGGMSLSLCRGEQELAGWHDPAQNDQAARLIPAIETLLDEAGLSYDKLDGFAVTVGPGGFTGVRIGLASARALGFAAGKPVGGCTTLDLMATGAPATAAAYLCALPAGRDQLYLQGFGADAPHPEPSLVPIAEARMLAERGLPLVVTDHPWTQELPDAASLIRHDIGANARLACRLVAQRGFTDASPLPLYIRPPDAKPQTPLLSRPRTG